MLIGVLLAEVSFQQLKLASSQAAGEEPFGEHSSRVVTVVTVDPRQLPLLLLQPIEGLDEPVFLRRNGRKPVVVAPDKVSVDGEGVALESPLKDRGPAGEEQVEAAVNCFGEGRRRGGIGGGGGGGR